MNFIIQLGPITQFVNLTKPGDVVVSIARFGDLERKMKTKLTISKLMLLFCNFRKEWQLQFKSVIKHVIIIILNMQSIAVAVSNISFFDRNFRSFMDQSHGEV